MNKKWFPLTRVIVLALFTLTPIALAQENVPLADTPNEAALFHALVAGGGSINQPFDANNPPAMPAAPANADNPGDGILAVPKKIKSGAIQTAISRIRQMRNDVADRFGAVPAAMAGDAAIGRTQTVAGIPVGPLPRLTLPSGNTTPMAIPLNSIPTINPGSWKSHGPHRVGGRIRSILVHPTNPLEMLLGSVSGGIWLTTNGGASWAPVDDFMASVAVSCMVYDPNDPLTVFAGTGEGFGNLGAVQGAGIFVSRDGGRSWDQLISTNNANFEFVNRIAIASTGAGTTVMLVATETGLFRSSDAGVSFTKVVGNSGGRRCLDVKFHPTDSSKCVATSKSRFNPNDGRAFFSTDGGDTWQFSTGISPGNRIEVCYSTANPNIVYAVIDKQRGILFRSTDGGSSFNFVNVIGHLGHAVFGEAGSQGWYNNCIWAGHPTNPNLIVVGGIDIHRSVNGGFGFTKITDWAKNNGPIVQSRDEPHADNHIIVGHPSFDGLSNKALFVGNDGGVFSTGNILTAGSENGWTSLNNGLAISQFYGVGVNTNNGNLTGGLQDNGAVFFDAAHPTDGWSWVEGGDGGYAAVDSDNDFYYGEYVQLALHRSDGGSPAVRINQTITDSAFFIAPFILSPNDPKILYGGGSRLWRTNNATANAPSFSPISPRITDDAISAIAVQKGNENNIWFGYGNGIQSPVFKSSVSGTSITWTPVHANTLPRRWVSRIVMDPNDSNRVYVTFTGYENDNLYRTEDGGNSWTDISNGLPEIPFRDIAIHPDNSAHLYLATEMGLFSSDDSGATWSPTNQGPTNTPVYQLVWDDRELYAATHGRGIFSIDLSLPSATPSAAVPLAQPIQQQGGKVD